MPEDTPETPKQPVGEPTKQVRVSPLSGVAPPVEHQFKKGYDPRRALNRGKNAGGSVQHYLNSMGELTLEQIETIAKAPNTNATKRLAAKTWIRALTDPDMADFEDVVMGGDSLKALKEAGVDTTRVKSLRRTEPGEKSGGSTAIELKDDTDKAIDRILDRTIGKPSQAVQVEAAVAVGVRVEIVTREQMDAVEVVDEIPADEK